MYKRQSIQSTSKLYLVVCLNIESNARSISADALYTGIITDKSIITYPNKTFYKLLVFLKIHEVKM